MHFVGCNQTPGDISWKKVFHFQTKRKFHPIISFIHNEFHLVGSVGINKKIHSIAFGHNAHM